MEKQLFLSTRCADGFWYMPYVVCTGCETEREILREFMTISFAALATLVQTCEN
jgi:hypothetical protein